MGVTEMDVLEARITRVEEALRAVEARLASFDRAPQPVVAAPKIEEPVDTPLFDFALIGKSVLIVGGAYLLRALTETGLVPQRAGVALAYLYAIAWIAIAGWNAARGRRTPALFAAATASMIGSALIWEATTRFRIVGPVVASILALVAVLSVFAIAALRRDAAFAFIGAALITFTSIGLAIGTGDPLPPAIVVSIAGVVAWRLQLDWYVSLLLAVLSTSFAIAVVAMAGVDRIPDGAAAAAVIAIAVLWILVIETRSEWPESLQTAAMTIVAAAGVSLLYLQPYALATSWAALAMLTAAAGRISRRRQWTVQAPFWGLIAAIAGFVPDARPALLAVGVFTFIALALTLTEARTSRLILLGVVTAIALAHVDVLLHHGDVRMLAMQRSVVVAAVAVLLSFAGRMRPEAARLAPLVLVFGAFKLLVEDFRTGGAATIALALAAYGTAMVVVARRKTPRLTLEENA